MIVVVVVAVVAEVGASIDFDLSNDKDWQRQYQHVVPEAPVLLGFDIHCSKEAASCEGCNSNSDDLPRYFELSFHSLVCGC